MTSYDDAHEARRAAHRKARLRAAPDVIDGEVVAVEVHDDAPRADRPSPGRGVRRPPARPARDTTPTGPDGAGLQDSLDQIERLAAELKEIAEVITAPPATGDRPATTRSAAGRRRAERAVPPAATGRTGAPRGAGPTFGPRNAPPSTSPATSPARDAGPRLSWLAADPDQAAPPVRRGSSIIREPLPREPKRRGNPELVFGAEIVPVDDPLPPTTPPPVTPPRAGKRIVAVAVTTTAALPTVDPATTTGGTRPAGRPAGSSGNDQRRPAGRQKGPRGRYTAIVIGAVALAVPAFALGAVQLWSTSAKTGDKQSVATGDRAAEVPWTAGEPSAAVSDPANPGATPSAASVAPRSPEEVTAGVAGDQPKKLVTAPKPASPHRATQRNSHPIGLSLSVRADDVRPQEGEVVRFRLSWKDGAGHYGGATQQWGDGSPTGGSVDVRPCTGAAASASGASEVTHTFTTAGTYTVRLSVTTYTCDGRTETQTVPMTILVQPKPSPSPTPALTTPGPTQTRPSTQG